MASQPMPVQAFYPQALATPGLQVPPQGMVANPAFYGSPAVAGTQQPAAGTAPYAVWPGGQAVVYSGTPAGAFYQPAVYPVPVPGTDGAPAPLALPTGPAAAAPAAAAQATDASAAAAAAANSQAAAAAAAAAAVAAAGKPADGQLATNQALMAPGIAGHQPILAGQPQPILPPEYWAQATALTAQAQGGHVQPGTALVQQNLAAVANAVAVASGQPAEMYPLDEREIKRQRRKQSNRESARRSRLRKQAECEDLNKKVDELADDNVSRRSHLEQMKALCEKYEAQNSALQARLGPRASNGESADIGKFHSTTAPLTPDMSSAGG